MRTTMGIERISVEYKLATSFIVFNRVPRCGFAIQWMKGFPPVQSVYCVWALIDCRCTQVQHIIPILFLPWIQYIKLECSYM